MSTPRDEAMAMHPSNYVSVSREAMEVTAESEIGKAVTSAAREHTVQVAALRRLSKTEVAGLRIGLDAISSLEAVLVGELANMRHAAEKETAIRNARGLPVPGPFGVTYVGTKRALCAIGLALEDTGQAVELEKVEKKK